MNLSQVASALAPYFQPLDYLHGHKSHHAHHGHPHAASSPDRFSPQNPEVALLTEDDRKKLAQALQECRDADSKTYYDEAADQAERDQYYGDAASKATGLDGNELYRTLSDLVSRTHTHQLPYDPSAYLYPWVDRHPGLDIESIYSGRKADPEELILADIQAGHEAASQSEQPQIVTGKNGQITVIEPHFHVNCEHVVPQSWFDRKLPMRGDLHHLFACETGINSERSSARYHEFPGSAPESVGTSNAEHTLFEPAGGKGAVARATLYFILRYPGLVGDRPGEYTADDLKLLLQWHHDYPVTEYERHRNAEIFHKQGNRNPLIDFPEWADKINFRLGLG